MFHVEKTISAAKFLVDHWVSGELFPANADWDAIQCRRQSKRSESLTPASYIHRDMSDTSSPNGTHSASFHRPAGMASTAVGTTLFIQCRVAGNERR
jgi:hypothetical protein